MSSHTVTLWMAWLMLLLGYSVQAQHTVRGVVKDAETGETLPAASIIIQDTYSGTVSNLDGRYSIQLDSLPATLKVSYIGYHSQTASIQTPADTLINLFLEPSTEELEEIVVTDEDPALHIMREVIKSKQQWRPQVKNYKAEAYTRAVLENDTSIVSITETVSDIYWEREKGHREVIKNRRQTNNIAENQNFTGVNYVPNFYDDDIKIAEFNLVGPTHPEALSFYSFKLIDQRQIDGQTVYEIQVTPKKGLQPTFKGTIFVLDEAFAMIQVELEPNKVVRFPPPIRDFNLDYQQQFRNFQDSLWLPVDMRVSGQIKIKLPGINFPMINFRQLSRITNYQINRIQPDSIFNSDNIFQIDTTSVKNDSLLSEKVDLVPLSAEEQEAYKNIDSTQTLDEAFKPSGVLAGLVNDDEGSNNNFIPDIPGQLSPQVRFNRVDEFFGGLSYEKRFFDRRLQLSGSGGFATGYDEFNYSAGIGIWPIPNTRRFVASFDYYKRTDSRYQSELYSMELTSFQPLMGARDYFDYLLNKGFTTGVGYMFPSNNVTVRMLYKDEDHESLTKNTEYDLLGRAPFRRENPAIDEGDLHSLIWRLEIGDGGLDDNFGVSGSQGATFEIEHSGDFINSDFDFTRYKLDASYRINTLYRRRFIPNTLDLNLRAGTFTGNLPLQRFGAIDGSLSSFSRFGAMRTLRNIPYTGEHYVSFTAEHHFRTIPFEILGLQWPVEQGWGLIGFGGLAQTWIGSKRLDDIRSSERSLFLQTDNLASEIGFSLNGIFSLFRIDVAYRVDDPSLFLGFGVAKLF